MHEPDTSEWTRPRTIVWAVVLGLAVLVVGKSFVSAFRPADDYIYDFIQEWLSGRNYFAGEPVYEDQRIALARHWPEFVPSNLVTFLNWNGHPPPAVLVVLPLAAQDYPTAHLIWNLITFPLFLVSIVLVWRELGGSPHPWQVLAVTALVILAAPVNHALLLGQLSFLLAFLLTLGWVADRRGYHFGAGAAVGLAAGLKLFPAFLLVYFLGARRWRAAVGLVAAFGAVNAAALAAFGVGAFETYVRVVIPGLRDYQSGWQNLSVNGWALRLLDPHPTQAGPEGYRNPALAVTVTAVAAVVVVAAVGWAARQSRAGADPDRGWAVALVGMMLVSPITWQHYLVMLVVPLGVLAVRLTARPARWCGWLAVALLCLPGTLFGILALGVERGRLLGPANHAAMTQAQNLLGISVQTYVLVALFVLTLLIPRRPAATAGPVER